MMSLKTINIDEDGLMEEFVGHEKKVQMRSR